MSVPVKSRKKTAITRASRPHITFLMSQPDLISAHYTPCFVTHVQKESQNLRRRQLNSRRSQAPPAIFEPPAVAGGFCSNPKTRPLPQAVLTLRLRPASSQLS